MTPQDIQLDYELKCDAAAASARLQELNSAAMSGDPDAPRANRLIAKMFDVVRGFLQAELDVKTRGPGAALKGWARRLGADRAALIAMRECIARCRTSGGRPGASAQSLTSSVGRLYETEVRVIEAEEVNPMYMERVHEQVKRNATTDHGHLRRLYNVAYDRVMKGELDSHLSDSECSQIGKFGVDACYQAGLIEKQTVGRGLVVFVLADEIAEYLLGYEEKDVHYVIDRGAGAMTCEPLPWTGLRGGGYLSVRRQAQFPLMIEHKLRRSERKAVREQFTAENMPMVFECANYLQSTPFTVHRPTFEAIRRVWGQGGGVMGLPKREKPEKPAFPFPEEWDKETATAEELQGFRNWKRAATQYYTDLKSWRGHTLELAGFLKLQTRDTSRLWFPVMMDTRGRWYYNGTPNPQGTDVAKAALHFADTKPLGPRGIFWLKVHIANSLGYDKKRAIQKAAYVDSIWEALEAALDAPEDHAGVWGKDAPWCAWSAAYELREALRSRNPAAYCTGIPIHMDATCSGLQHFSAMLRDETGGRYVNLFDSGGDEKQDIYRKVAEEGLQTMLTHSASAARQFWLEAGISRNQAKKPVMTYVYGATLRGTSEFLEAEALHDRDDNDREKGERNCDIATYGAKVLFAGIEATVPAAAEAMRWLREVCRTVPDGRMVWTTPTGFKVQHDYQEVEQVRVKLNSCGVTKVTFNEPLDACNPSKMQNAIAPNFVHALDASHLTFTALAMKQQGLSFVGIHDSFGTHPCDVDAMHRTIREQFVKLYTEHDVIMDFLWEVGGTGILPKMGKLDLNKVLTSEFMFC